MRFVLLFVAAASLAACGYRGPLYLPKPGAQTAKPASAKPAPPPDRPEPDSSAKPQ